MSGQDEPGRSLAEKLDHLFAHVTRRNGTEFTYEEVASAITAEGVTISQSYVWQLRKGKKDNPTLKHLQGLADFFGVPVTYFFNEGVSDRVDRQLEYLRAEQARLRELAETDEVRLMAMRAGELTTDRRELVKNLLDVVWRDQQAMRERGSKQD
ncbi:helix-turn-helix domain-containing protein [Amycolatopsis sp. EV170708-02-1]|uniref:helix-turn-helix domain-containing protein n=1 Tax=Amycolatopsis sp. EV170708-02-1 TaxID=2919322 RepID=UPI001F0C8994|nr:helix-turn-helix domain-containing protein [Amycolatopsis sp. EV170708-02-1]UMO99884.1 helix-turn-helix domain-containing protein [Amycolatopsis sp. EV170708-02-1]